MIWVHATLTQIDVIYDFEKKYQNDPKETPYRYLLKEIFKYSDHVDIITFRNASLKKLVDDQMSSKKHISFDTVNSVNSRS